MSKRRKKSEFQKEFERSQAENKDPILKVEKDDGSIVEINVGDIIDEILEERKEKEDK